MRSTLFPRQMTPSNRMGGGKRNGARYSRNRSRPLESIKDGECGTEQMAEKKRNALYIPINSPRGGGGGGLNGLFRRRENLANGVPLAPKNRER